MRGGAGPLAVGVGVAGLGLFFLLGAQTIPGEAQYAGVGPRVFPSVIGAGLVALGAAFLVAVRRGVEFPALALPPEPGVLPWMLGGLVAATVLVEWAGFPVAATVLFAFAARAFGSRRWAVNVLLGVVLGVVVYIAFARMLGISLPGGPLGAVPDERRIPSSSVGPDPQRTGVRFRSGPPCVLGLLAPRPRHERGSEV
jgi:putative tricarboxylic transport membrane protein